MTERYPGGKHYLTYDTAMKQRFGKKIIKLSLNAGFTCPNRDGSKGTGGCIFCTASGSGDFSGNAMDSISVQLQKEAERMRSTAPISLIFRPIPTPMQLLKRFLKNAQRPCVFPVL